MKLFKILLIMIFTTSSFMITPDLFSKKSNEDESIILPSTYGWIQDGEVNISIHAWIFELKKNSILRNGFIELLKNHFENAGNEEKQIFDERIRYFLTDNKRGEKIIADISGKKFRLPETLPNGHTLSIIKIKNDAKPDSINDRQISATLSGNDKFNTFTGTFQIISEKGYSIISDIDDTIKESNVLNKKELLNNTFFKEFHPIKGMPDIYKKFEKNGFAFHYVSGSPWQLYPAINTFLHNGQFPEGAVELKLFRIKDKSLINFISADQLSYKISAIKTIIDRFPQRKFILIGDSGEKDPEVYTEIASQYKERIKYIFIRNVGLIDENSPRRKTIIEKADKVKIVIFKDAIELESYTQNL